MVIEIPTEIKTVSIIPESEIEEIAQNVRMILHTFKGQVPLDRNFGIDSEIIDMPVNVARTKMTTRIVKAVNDSEPRVKVKEVKFSGDAVDGLVVASVVVELVESRLRGYV